MKLGEKIRKTLELRGMSQMELSRKSGVSRTLINDILKGKETITLDTIKKLANNLNVTAAYLIDEDLLTPFDVLPENMPQDLRQFLLNQNNMPVLKLTKDAMEKGLTEEDLKGILQVFTNIKDKSL